MHHCMHFVVVQSLSRVSLCEPMDCSMPGFPVLHYLPEFAQTHVHWVGDAVQPSHHLSSPSPPAFNLSQNQGLFQWVSSSHQLAKVLELQLQHQSFQWIFRVDSHIMRHLSLCLALPLPAPHSWRHWRPLLMQSHVVPESTQQTAGI